MQVVSEGPLAPCAINDVQYHAVQTLVNVTVFKES